MLGPQLSKFYKFILVWCIFNKKKVKFDFLVEISYFPCSYFHIGKSSISKLFSGINFIFAIQFFAEFIRTLRMQKADIIIIFFSVWTVASSH